MLFSATTEYALRAVAWLAIRSGESQTVDQIAKSAHLSAGYLAKVLQTLGRAGLVHSQRGVGGGFRLARPADELNVLEIVNAVDPIRRIRECPLGLPGHHERLCPLHARLDAALEAIEEGLRSTTIGELTTGAQGVLPLTDDSGARPAAEGCDAGDGARDSGLPPEPSAEGEKHDD